MFFYYLFTIYRKRIDKIITVGSPNQQVRFDFIVLKVNEFLLSLMGDVSKKDLTSLKYSDLQSSYMDIQEKVPELTQPTVKTTIMKLCYFFP